MDTTTSSGDKVIQTLEVSETIPEMDEEKVTGTKTEENRSWPLPEKDEKKVTGNKTEENHSWRHGLSQLPPLSHPQYRPNAGHHFHREWKPKCNHYTMTRLYTDERCQNCGSRNNFGWLYRCTVDREALIIHNRDMGLPYAFDSFGHHIGEVMTLGKRGPQARSDKLSFLKELTKEELATYTPEQLVIISQQRDHVAAMIEEARILGKAKTPCRDKPWMPSRESECQFKVCHSCHHFGMEKSTISLNAILNDEIPPTVATSYGFHLLGFHQMAHASIVKNIGYRPIRLPRHHPARADSQTPHRLRLKKGPADELWESHRANFPPRGSLRRTLPSEDLRFSAPDPSVRMALRSITTPHEYGSLRKRWAPELLLEGPGPYGQNLRALAEKEKRDAEAVREYREAMMSRTPDTPIARMFMAGKEENTPPRQIGGGNTTTAGSSSSSAPVVDDDETIEDSTILPDIDEATEDSSGTWETASVADDSVALTEEAVELGTPDMVAL